MNKTNNSRFAIDKQVQFSQKVTVVPEQQSIEKRINRSNSFSLPNSRRSSFTSVSSSLEYSSSLEEFHQENFDEIRQLIPDEFEKLIPLFIQLGVLILPKKFLDNQQQQQLTTRELIERHRLFILMKNYQDNLQSTTDLQHFYGNTFAVLRESLSFIGQLALIHSYQDQIERELNKKMFAWKTIPINQISEYSSSTNKSPAMKKKSPTIKSNENSSLKIDQNLFKQFSLPKQLDSDWQRKSIPFLIEQGFALLDQIRTLPSNDHHIHLIRAFRRWTFLWSTLYAQQRFQ